MKVNSPFSNCFTKKCHTTCRVENGIPLVHLGNTESSKHDFNKAEKSSQLTNDTRRSRNTPTNMIDGLVEPPVG